MEYTEEQLEKMLADKKAVKQQELNKKKAAYEKEKEEFVKDTIYFFSNHSRTLKKLKERCIEVGTKLHSDMYAVYDKEEKKQKQFSLESNDGMFKVVIESQDRQAFNEQAEVHINTIKDILKNTFEKRSKSAYKVLNDVLMKNNKGDYDERLVAKLNKHRDVLNNPDYNEALDQLANCYTTYASSLYVRAYEKDETGTWQNINIQFSSI